MSHKIKTKNKNNHLIIITIIILILVSSILVLLLISQKKSSLPPAKKNLKTKIKITPQSTILISPSPETNYNVQTKKMFFTYKIETVDLQNKILYINLNGENSSTSDAIDIQLEIDSNIEVKKIVEGNSFSFYPRKIINQNDVLITGLALSDKGELKLAEPQSNFIKIFLLIKNPYQKSSIKLNQEKSKIFLGGEEITDIKKSFKEIIF